ncbi:hypothetical protein Pan216_43930 [Planctomycetes bacterium Pan216]|uniref:Uncharacterized protein n=1 Tax=Kolteria novifilia TaxID=2527975 RepID=A0A518B969_9BACT|nr:hypothetical protein Pan216_43930 [Planctomycetes bacterium Pan216]
MLEEINEQLVKAKERRLAKLRLVDLLACAREDIREQRERCDELRVELDDEKEDVEILEGMTLTSLFQYLAGTRDEQLEKERREYVAAKIKHEEALEAIKESEADRARYESELESFDGADEEYDAALAAKAATLDNANGAANRLEAIGQRSEELEAKKQELVEAAQAGRVALQSLEQVRESLDSARGWGHFDMLGGGMLATMAKHSHLDQARDHVRTAQLHLRRFRRELAHTDHSLQISIEFSGLLQFSDYFFDGLIADWMVQSEISNAASSCEDAVRGVRELLDECRQRLNQCDRELTDQEMKRQRLIEEA